jgi:hypothetical protein
MMYFDPEVRPQLYGDPIASQCGVTRSVEPIGFARRARLERIRATERLRRIAKSPIDGALVNISRLFVTNQTSTGTG